MGILSDKVNSFIFNTLGRYNQFVDMIKEYCNEGIRQKLGIKWVFAEKLKINYV